MARSEATEFAGVIQFENSAVKQNIARFGDTSSVAVITYRSLADSLKSLTDYLGGNADICSQWSRSLDIDLSDRKVVVSLMLNAAAYMNKRGIVLFSTTNPERIVENVRSVAECSCSSHKLELFMNLAGGKPKGQSAAAPA